MATAATEPQLWLGGRREPFLGACGVVVLEVRGAAELAHIPDDSPVAILTFERAKDRFELK